LEHWKIFALRGIHQIHLFLASSHPAKLYQIYVADYLETKSIDRSRKKKIIIYIYILMGISIYFAPIIFVKIGLALLTVFITYYLFKVIPDK